MKRKLFAFDIDGTLLDSNKRPLASTIEALQELRSAGHFVTLATGRTRFLAQDLIYQLEFDNYILCNGSAAFLNHHQVYKHLLPRMEMQHFVKEANGLGIDTVFVGIDAYKRNTSFNLATIENAMHSVGSVAPDLDHSFPQREDIYQGLAFYDTSLENYFDDKYPNLSFVRWHENGVDVIPKGGSKAATILEIAHRLGIDQEDIVSFGDGMNDREMLQASGCGVAMGNAPKEVALYADRITDDNDHDGIWQALDELGFLNRAVKKRA
ncbi:HAD family hydrolase [Tetragenococcus koreensis]|uniref:Haloacid dehalogenase n=1 Tax=Tetragenococcus koreensis TaxID=290335 RepID=A0AAN4ZPI3_9ENTE|nr:HAD family hydrolase [Tetragenococcus koreensis]AYW45811.1 Cof-type HAD-IIB family hydrolase [Tetragenococcus koreensis]MCF1585388.1 HAD family hydrolase [Tetragenococcus koreensis]MCF1614911.1 HAD family hydrolase [Tetragenococcus koreensis]MCF1616652.1 HAD family hydrolase [Tetragenococcus koreensis]MCF1619108.1 HAD family hydrolase [Tetragenococcus koreensis]